MYNIEETQEERENVTHTILVLDFKGLKLLNPRRIRDPLTNE